MGPGNGSKMMERCAGTQTVACYHCGADRNTFYAAENGYTLVRCDGCGLLFVNPRPNTESIEQAQMLGVHKGDSAINVTGRFSRARARQYPGILRELYGDELTRGVRRWLDIGCGHGEFLHALKVCSGGMIRASGIEPNMAKRKAARSRGLDVLDADLKGLEGRYHFISMLNVYSHLPDPPDFIAGVKRLLLPGGELLLETGDTAHFADEDHFRPFYLPDHLSFASEAIVSNILDRAGFEILAIKKYPFIPVGLASLAKETLKLLMLRQQSRLRYFMRPRQEILTDMYIRARLRG